ncbi:MAG: DUF3667 domain-containing protein, partial [Acidobacteriota bacterium]
GHFDGKIIRTLRYLFTRPGFLTREFLEGRRVRYITPLRLYLLMVALFSVLLAFLGSGSAFVQVHTDSPKAGPASPAGKPASGELDRRIQRGFQRFDGHPEKLAEEVGLAVPKAMFVLMPLFGAIVMIFERRREHFYIPHLYFAVHFHAFAFGLFSIITMIGAPQITVLRVLGKALVFSLFVYLYVALRRVYGDSRIGATMKTVAISLLYGVCVVTAMMAIVFVVVAGV